MDKLNILETLELDECTPDIQLVWKECTPDTAKSLLIGMGGSTIHVPLLRTMNIFTTRMMKTLRERGDSPEKIARELGVSATHVRKTLGE